MNYKSSKNFSISTEFQKILNDYIKEVIRYKPKDIIDFSYKYFYCLENNLPLNSTFIKKINGNSVIDKEIIINKRETLSSTIEHNEIKNLIDINKSNDNEIIKTNTSNNITPRNTEEEYDNVHLDDSEVNFIRFPLEYYCFCC